MAADIRDEIRRLHRRKQLQYVFPEGEQPSTSHSRHGRFDNTPIEDRMQDSGSDGGNSSGAESPTPITQQHVSRAERALFTFSQVSLMYNFLPELTFHFILRSIFNLCLHILYAH